MREGQIEEILAKAYQLGHYYEGQNPGCAQAVLRAIGDLFDLDPAVVKAASSFCGGIANGGTGNCGAFTGGLMALSYFLGRDIAHMEMSGRKFSDRQLAQALRRMFMDEYGSEICRGVQEAVFGRPFDLTDPQDKEAFIAAGAHHDKCTAVVGRSARWVTAMLLDEGVPVADRTLRLL